MLILLNVSTKFINYTNTFTHFTQFFRIDPAIRIHNLKQFSSAIKYVTNLCDLCVCTHDITLQQQIMLYCNLIKL